MEYNTTQLSTNHWVTHQVLLWRYAFVYSIPGSYLRYSCCMFVLSH